MADRDRVVLVRPGDRRIGDPTPGMVREEAITVDGLWSGFVTTEPETTSGWHHHGDHDTAVYVVAGTIRMEFGAGGRETVDAQPGDFLHVPRHVVHREGNPGSTAAQVIVTRSGTGPVTVNVDEPAP